MNPCFDFVVVVEIGEVCIRSTTSTIIQGSKMARISCVHLAEIKGSGMDIPSNGETIV